MKLEKIQELWDEDKNIDLTELAAEAVKIPKLHHKYYTIFAMERMSLRKLETEFKQLKLTKYLFYTEGPSKEQVDSGWLLPPRGRIMKTDVPMYLDADPDMIELSLKIGYAQEKVELLESIIKSLNPRGFQIKSAIDFRKWTESGGI